MYKYGEKILVGCSGEYGWWEEIFIAEANGVVFTAANKYHLNQIMKCEQNPLLHNKHKPIPKKKVIPYTLETFPLDNSGMVRLKVWGKGEYSTISQKRSDGIYYVYGENISFCKFHVLADHYEWLQKDGTVKPFGIEVDDE